jgi:hypothetical protein
MKKALSVLPQIFMILLVSGCYSDQEKEVSNQLDPGPNLQQPRPQLAAEKAMPSNVPFRLVSVPKNFDAILGMENKSKIRRPRIAFTTPEGKIVVVAAVANEDESHDTLRIARFSDGELDPSFGRNGWLMVAQPANYMAKGFQLHRVDDRILILGTGEKKKATGIVFLLSLTRDGARSGGKSFRVVTQLTNLAGDLRGVYRPKITSVRFTTEAIELKVREERPREDLGNYFEGKIQL